jgi:hypothetical protein
LGHFQGSMIICTPNRTCRRPLTRKLLYDKSYFWSIIVRAIVFLGKCLSGQMLSGQMSFWANVFLGNRLSAWANFPLGKCLLGKCLSGQMFFWANVLLGKCLMGKCFSGKMYFLANVFWANVFLGKCLMGKCLSGQMSFMEMSSRQTSHWANVVWANVSGQMSYGQM